MNKETSHFVNDLVDKYRLYCAFVEFKKTGSFASLNKGRKERLFSIFDDVREEFALYDIEIKVTKQGIVELSYDMIADYILFLYNRNWQDTEFNRWIYSLPFIWNQFISKLTMELKLIPGRIHLCTVSKFRIWWVQTYLWWKYGLE